MRLAEPFKDAEPSWERQPFANLNAGADRAMRVACAGWRRSARNLSRAISAAARYDASSRRVDHALQLGDEVAGWIQTIGHIEAVSSSGLRDKVGICITALKQCGDEPAKHIDDLALSCLYDAERMLAAYATPSLVNPIIEVTGVCNFIFDHFNDDLLALQNEELSIGEEDACISKMALRNEELMDAVFQLSQFSAASPREVIAKGGVLRRLIDAGHWECLHRRDLAISYCDDLLGLLALPSRGPSLFFRASQMIVSFAGM